VIDRRLGRLARGRQWCAIEAGTQDRLDLAIRAGTDGDAACTGGFQSVVAMDAAEPDDVEARAISLLGVGDGVHWACCWWDLGMCSSTVVWVPRA